MRLVWSHKHMHVQCAVLLALVPGIPIFSEEWADYHTDELQRDWWWCIDKLLKTKGLMAISFSKQRDWWR